MRVLFLVPYPTEGASNRFRVEQYFPTLKKAGINYSMHPFWRKSAFDILYKRGYFFKKVYFFTLGTLSRIVDILQIYRYDIVFIHREAYPVGGAFFETILYLMKKPFIFDFDDAIFLPFSSYSNNFIEWFRKPSKVAKIIKMSTHVIAGNRSLSDFAMSYNHSVSIIPTPIDTDIYFPVDKETDDKVVIGWMGSLTTVDFLNMIRDVFISLSKQYRYIRFKIVGGEFSINALPNILNKAWSLKEEIEDLKTFDIGIMPMSDNDWTRGKCGFKAILYMSMGIPCVCSPVGVNKEIIKDGVNGFLADTEQKWVEKLSSLIEDSLLRHKIGMAGRKVVEERYSLAVNAPKFLEIFYKLYNERKYDKSDRLN